MKIWFKNKLFDTKAILNKEDLPILKETIRKLGNKYQFKGIYNYVGLSPSTKFLILSIGNIEGFIIKIIENANGGPLRLGNNEYWVAFSNKETWKRLDTETENAIIGELNELK